MRKEKPLVQYSGTSDESDEEVENQKAALEDSFHDEYDYDDQINLENNQWNEFEKEKIMNHDESDTSSEIENKKTIPFKLNTRNCIYNVSQQIFTVTCENDGNSIIKGKFPNKSAETSWTCFIFLVFFFSLFHLKH